jgi:hypothetical protein
MAFMIRSIGLMTIVAVSVWSTAVAQAPAGAPAGATGQCRDGSYWTGETKKGACRGHKGVQDWYAGTTAAATTGASAGAPAAASTAAAAPAPAPAAAAAAPAATGKGPAAAAAPGGGPGLVWVNTSTKVYHCPTDKWYGKTKHGEYLSESDAIAKGDHADHGKACSK